MKSSELVARTLVDHIVDNDLPEGTVLPGERTMAESLGVGRVTLREALRLLESRGALTIRKGARGGPVVRRPRAVDVSEALTLALQFQGGVLQDVFAARELLECLVVQEVGDRITEGQLDELEMSQRRARSDLDNTATFLAETQLFHHLLNEAAGNMAIQIFNQTLHAVTNKAVSHVLHHADHREQVLEAHDAVIAALRGNDVTAATDAMRHHVRQSSEYWNSMAGDLGSIPVRWLQEDGLANLQRNWLDAPRPVRLEDDPNRHD